MAFLKEYENLGELGKVGGGSFAQVYKVRHNELGYVRAIRVLKELIVDENSKTYKDFLTECKYLLRLGNSGHPNIVRILQPRLIDNKAFWEMDYIEGSPVDDFIEANRGFVPIEEVKCFLLDISNALAYCHVDNYRFSLSRDDDKDCFEIDKTDGSKLIILNEKKLIEKYCVIHNDIKSNNVMRKYDGSYILLDFGLAFDKNKNLSRSSLMRNGGVEYKAPEKWDMVADLMTEQTDIYSFGILLYEMLVGRVPFPYNSNVSVERANYELSEHHKHTLVSAIEPLRRAACEAAGKQWNGKDYPDRLEHIILKCLEKDPKNRYANGKELFDDVKKYIVNNNKMPLNNSAEIEELQEQNKVLKDYVGRLVYEKQQLEDEKISLLKRLDALQTNDTSTKNQPKTQPILTGFDMEMVYVEGGTFTMGTNGWFSDNKAHQVTLSSYYIGKYEVTQAQWEAIMGNNLSYFKGDNLPVENVSWGDVQEFIRKLNAKTGKNYRLPTEAEWEYAARGGKNSRAYKYSGSDNLENVAWHYANGGQKTHAVGTKSSNELGIYDMSGNVWEWCSDWYGSYGSGSQTNPGGASSGSYRVILGGSWLNNAQNCRVAYRDSRSPDFRNYDLGFRLACSTNP